MGQMTLLHEHTLVYTSHKEAVDLSQASPPHDRRTRSERNTRHDHQRRQSSTTASWFIISRRALGIYQCVFRRDQSHCQCNDLATDGMDRMDTWRSAPWSSHCARIYCCSERACLNENKDSSIRRFRAWSSGFDLVEHHSDSILPPQPSELCIIEHTDACS